MSTKTIWDYPVSFPFGATTPPYSKLHPHSGEDRAAPQATPIPVSGVLLGYVGSTGEATGPHLHIQKAVKIDGQWRFVNPEGSGANITGVVTEVLYNTEVGNCARILDTNGTRWSYFHMKNVPLVKVGDKIGGDMLASKQQVIDIFNAVLGVNPSSADVAPYVGKEFSFVFQDVYQYAIKNKRDYMAYKANSGNATVLPPGNYKVS